MSALDSSRNIPSMPALWIEFRQSLRDTDSESLGFALDILQHNAESLDQVDVNASLSTASPAQREKIGKIISSVFRMQSDGEVQVFAESSGFIDGNECAQASIEQELWDSSELIVSLDSLYLSLFCTKKTTFPSPLPDLIGTPEAPGELSVKIQKHLQELQEQCETLKKRSEEERDPEKKERLTQEQKNLSKTLQERTSAYKAVKRCIQEAPKLQLFPDTAPKRQEAYQRFAYRLNQGFDALKAESLECQFFAEDGGIADLPTTCFTGWHTRIEAMIEGSGQKRGAMMQKAHLLARDLRRSIMQEGVLRAALRHQGYREEDISRTSMEVHNRQAAKQWANEPFNLGYSQEELGRNEMMRDALSNSFEAVAQGVMDEEYPKALSKMLIDDFRQMNSAEREGFLGGILSEYRKGCRQDPTLLIDPLDERQALYEEMERANNLEKPQERLNALREVRKRFTEEGTQSPFNLRTPYEGLEAELRMNYPRPAFVKVFQKFQNASESERLKALQEAYQDLKPEQKDPALKAFIESMQNSLSPKMQEEHLQRQKREISGRARGFEDFRISKNVSLLERKLCNGQELSEFGAHLWLCSAKLLAPRNTTNIRVDKPAQILQWAHEQYPALSSAQVLEKLREDPSLYFHLPQNLQELAEVREYLDENPWIELGAPSLEEYEHYLSQDPQTIDLANSPAWVRGCKEVMLVMVRENGYDAWQFANRELKNDGELALAAICHENLNNYRKLPLHTQQLPEIREYVQANPWLKSGAPSKKEYELYFLKENIVRGVKGGYLPIWVKSCREIFLPLVAESGATLQWASEELKKDREVVLAAVKQNGLALQWASEELKKDREIALAAVQQNDLALKYASKELQNDREIALAAVTNNGDALECASKELQNDPDIVLQAVINRAQVLQFVHEDIQNNHEFMIQAVTNNADVLKWANEEIKNNDEVVLAAVKQNGLALQWAAYKVQKNDEVILAAVKQNGLALEWAYGSTQGNYEAALAAVKQNGLALQHVSGDIQSNDKIVLAAVKQNGLALLYVNEYSLGNDEIVNNKEIVLAAVTNNGMALQYASEELSRDPDIVLAAVANNGMALQYASEELSRDPDIVLAAVTNNGDAWQYASEELSKDRKIALAAVTNNGLALRYASEELSKDRKIVRAAVSENGYALEYASEELQNDPDIVLAAKQ